ncbi:DUF3445 domain-containing protein [soil metagenome]
MGLRPLDPSAWLEVDDRFASDLAEKERLLRDHHSAVVAVVDDPDGSVLVASTELLQRLLAHLELPGSAAAADAHPIDAAGRLTQEDWCLHLPDDDGSWRLVAASVCFPTRWNLDEKIGRTIRQIHAPVPFYEEQLADPMDGYFARMRPGQGVWRLNWNLMDDPTLHQPLRSRAGRPGVPLDPADVGEQIWLRVERQTLVKLPETGAIVFSIRIHEDPLDRLRGDDEALARLQRSLEGLPPLVWEDKGLAGIGGQILEWISDQRDPA